MAMISEVLYAAFLLDGKNKTLLLPGYNDNNMDFVPTYQRVDLAFQITCQNSRVHNQEMFIASEFICNRSGGNIPADAPVVGLGSK